MPSRLVRYAFTHHVDTLALPSCLVVVVVVVEVVVAAVVVAGQSPVPAVRKRKMKRTWKRMKKSRVEGRSEGTGSSGWAPPIGSSGWKEQNITSVNDFCSFHQSKSEIK